MPQIDWPVLIAGAILSVGGWVLYWVAIQTAGALLGAALAGAVAWGVTSHFAPQAIFWAVPAGVIIGFVLGIFLSRGIHRAIFFFLGSAFGVAAATYFFRWCIIHYGWPSEYQGFWRAGFLVAGSIVGGAFASRGSRLIVVLATALVGSVLIVTSIADPLAILALLPLLIVSFLVQMGALRYFLARRNEREEGARG